MKVIVKCTCGVETTINNKPFEIKEDFLEQLILAFECLVCNKKIAVFACDTEKVNVIKREEADS